jgi:hypothetical protein
LLKKRKKKLLQKEKKVQKVRLLQKVKQLKVLMNNTLYN